MVISYRKYVVTDNDEIGYNCGERLDDNLKQSQRKLKVAGRCME